MKKVIVPEFDRPAIMLGELCKCVSGGEVRCPSPRVLTLALRPLFPPDYFPPGTEIAINESRRSSWYADRETDLGEAKYSDVIWLRRRLSRTVLL